MYQGGRSVSGTSGKVDRVGRGDGRIPGEGRGSHGVNECGRKLKVWRNGRNRGSTKRCGNGRNQKVHETVWERRESECKGDRFRAAHGAQRDRCRVLSIRAEHRQNP